MASTSKTAGLPAAAETTGAVKRFIGPNFAKLWECSAYTQEHKEGLLRRKPLFLTHHAVHFNLLPLRSAPEKRTNVNATAIDPMNFNISLALGRKAMRFGLLW